MFVEIHFLGVGQVEGSGWEVRVDVNRGVKFLHKLKKWGVRFGEGGQGGCERRIEVFVKIKKIEGRGSSRVGGSA